MRKFLVFFVLLFGVVCGAMAAGKWPQNVQDDNINNCGTVWDNDGSVELVAWFDTDVIVGCDMSELKNWLSELESEIGSIMIYGSADRQRRDGKPDNNVILSQRRAQWAIDNIVPNSFKQYCSFGATQSQKCQVHAMGDADDYANSSDNGARNSNASARAVHVYVIFREAKCEQDTMDNINQTKETLTQIQSKYADKADKINEALGIISDLNIICTKDGDSLYASESKKYSRLLSELGTILVNLAKTIPGISMLIQQSNFSAMFSTADIDLYYSRIQGLMGNRSVWRNTEGRFNTARLASDSIAGVVLGTIGGIVTSKLVKKNQLKQGFEDLSCNVGGQRVADYGDTFSIGLQ